MKTVYFDQTSADGPAAVFSSTARVVPAGTGIHPMPVKYRNETYRHLEEKLDICFLFQDTVPEVRFYAVPHLEIVAYDRHGGFLGTLDDGKFLYIDGEGSCFAAGQEVRVLLTMAQDWWKDLVPYPGLRLFSSRETAKQELEFIEVKIKKQPASKDAG